MKGGCYMLAILVFEINKKSIPEDTTCDQIEKSLASSKLQVYKVENQDNVMRVEVFCSDIACARNIMERTFGQINVAWVN